MQEKVSLLESKHRQQLQRVQDKVEAAQQDLADMTDRLALAEEQKQEAINQVRQQASKDMVRSQILQLSNSVRILKIILRGGWSF